MEGVLVAPVHAALIAHRGGEHQVEFDASIAGSLEGRAALLAEPISRLLGASARRAGKARLDVHVHVLGRIWLA